MAALERFQAQGYDRTTVEEIAGDVGMSTRTYFRYYPSKDDVLLDHSRAFRDTFMEALQAHLPNGDLWTALAQALEATAAGCEKLGDGTQSRQLQDLVSRTPALLARQLEISEAMQMAATELCLAESEEASALGWATTNAVIRAGFSCLRATQSVFSGDIQSDEALAELRRLLAVLRPAQFDRLPSNA